MVSKAEIFLYDKREWVYITRDRRRDMNKKVIFFDIDGTLYDHDKKIPESTKRAVRLLKEKGHHLFIASGRSPF